MTKKQYWIIAGLGGAAVLWAAFRRRPMSLGEYPTEGKRPSLESDSDDVDWTSPDATEMM